MADRPSVDFRIKGYSQVFRFVTLAITFINNIFFTKTKSKNINRTKHNIRTKRFEKLEKWCGLHKATITHWIVILEAHITPIKSLWDRMVFAGTQNICQSERDAWKISTEAIRHEWKIKSELTMMYTYWRRHWICSILILFCIICQIG